ncbi:hypothetical protein [Dawidia soli]|uniref:Uncharacterized protein n=1 Tax=Dawidia soli TaxID=2782352 RepID=A0AAP2GJB8_9BACT|nr:hypothetical protein [Dawidia soli]MBT1689241.1 hypothetical protein [Dawidia soli]
MKKNAILPTLAFAIAVAGSLYASTLPNITGYARKPDGTILEVSITDECRLNEPVWCVAFVGGNAYQYIYRTYSAAVAQDGSQQLTHH